MLAIADVLGVPEDDHETFREGFGLRATSPSSISLGGAAVDYELQGSEWLDEWFYDYLEARRHDPRHDVLTDLALGEVPRWLDATHNAVVPDGDVPVRGGPGDDRPPARGRAEDPRRVQPSSKTSSRRTPS